MNYWKNRCVIALWVCLIAGPTGLFAEAVQPDDAPEKQTAPAPTPETTGTADQPAKPEQPAETKKNAEPVAAAPAPETPIYKPGDAEIEAAEKRIALRQYTAELVVAYKYQLRASIPGLMRKLAELAPDSAELRYFEALQYYSIGERGRALIKLDEALYREPHVSRAWNLQGIILSEADRLPEARQAFTRAVEHNPYNPNYVFNLASVEYRLGMTDAAQNSVRRSIELKPNLSEGYYLQGRIHRNRKQYGQALMAFTQASHFGQDSQDFLLDYMLVAEAAGDEKTVPDLADRLSGTRDPRTLRELARIHSKYGEYKEATGYLARLIRLPEAKAPDRRDYVYALHKSKANTMYAIQSIPKLEAAERDALIKYLRELEAGDRETPGTRDPMLKPIK